MSISTTKSSRRRIWKASAQGAAAALRYRDALGKLQSLQADQPGWNPQVVKFRLEFLQDKLIELAKFLPAATNAPVVVSNAPPVVPSATPSDPAAVWRAQVEALNASNAQLQQKLKEALSVQPSVTPEELAKAQEKIDALQKENDLLKVTLEQRNPPRRRRARRWRRAT